MTAQTAIRDLFDSPAPQAQPDLPLRAVQPATEKQLSYARILAARTKSPLPPDLAQDRAALSRWIDQHKAPKPEGRFAAYPSGKQVAFAERIARLKRREVPQDCFRDRRLMARWIDSHKPR